jgi:hypothetical protein
MKFVWHWGKGCFVTQTTTSGARERIEMNITRAAFGVVERIRNRPSEVHVVATSDGADFVRAQAICSCRKLQTPERRTVQHASDDAFQHRCSTEHRMAAPLVRVGAIADTSWRAIA